MATPQQEAARALVDRQRRAQERTKQVREAKRKAEAARSARLLDKEGVIGS